jgi:hypothetical protein
MNGTFLQKWIIHFLLCDMSHKSASVNSAVNSTNISVTNEELNLYNT